MSNENHAADAAQAAAAENERNSQSEQQAGLAAMTEFAYGCIHRTQISGEYRLEAFKLILAHVLEIHRLQQTLNFQMAMQARKSSMIAMPGGGN